MKRPAVVWALTGLVFALGMLAPAWLDLAGGVVFVVAVGLPFLVWRRIGGRDSWVALITSGVVMAGVLYTAFATSAGCPAGNDLVQLQKGKRPVACKEIRASYLTFGTLFAALALAGVTIPVGRRRGWFDVDPDLDLPDSAG